MKDHMQLLLTQLFYDFLQVISKTGDYAQEPRILAGLRISSFYDTDRCSENRHKFILCTKKALFSTGSTFISAPFCHPLTIFQSP
jgi:hypothetical protein